MGTKENFNQAMQEVFPFYKNSKATTSNTSAGADITNLAGQTSSSAVKLETYPTNEPLDFESITSVKKQEIVETTRITKDTKITGTIIARSNIEINGDVYGDVESQHTIKITGKVEGNVTGKDVEISSATVKGNIHANEQLTVKNQSSIVGNINANEVEFNGKITGNINAKKDIAIQKEAGIIGDISASTISIEKGAMLKGQMSILGEIKTDLDDEISE
ncbi:MAG: polymer-forming cytoskeletal protein [Clostridia bacterium]|nr:polymer-forming cytoskeletal protein [Clostridia bacterium]